MPFLEDHYNFLMDMLTLYIIDNIAGTVIDYAEEFTGKIESVFGHMGRNLSLLKSTDITVFIQNQSLNFIDTNGVHTIHRIDMLDNMDSGYSSSKIDNLGNDMFALTFNNRIQIYHRTELYMVINLANDINRVSFVIQLESGAIWIAVSNRIIIWVNDTIERVIYVPIIVYDMKNVSGSIIVANQLGYSVYSSQGELLYMKFINDNDKTVSKAFLLVTRDNGIIYFVNNNIYIKDSVFPIVKLDDGTVIHCAKELSNGTIILGDSDGHITFLIKKGNNSYQKILEYKMDHTQIRDILELSCGTILVSSEDCLRMIQNDIITIIASDRFGFRSIYQRWNNKVIAQGENTCLVIV